MLKKFLSVLLCPMFCIGCFVCTPTYAVRCNQKGPTSIFEHTDAADISRTVDAIWEVYNAFNSNRGRTMQPWDAADLIVQVLDANGLDSFKSRNGTKLSHAIACAIFHSHPDLVEILIDGETNTYMHFWSHPVSCDDLSVATYKFAEDFKKAGYVDGANNYVALLVRADFMPGSPPGCLFHLCQTPALSDGCGRLSGLCRELEWLLGQTAW